MNICIKNKNKGFTLIELLVVVAIISLLSSIVMASLNSARKKVRDAQRAQDMQTIYIMLTQYNLEYGHIPVTTIYGESEQGGFDVSSLPSGAPSFMSFLITQGIAPKSHLIQ